jgi:hypothetical protein
MGQHHILLRLIEPVELVHEQNRPLSVHPQAVLGLLDDAPQIGNPSGYSGHLIEV